MNALVELLTAVVLAAPAFALLLLTVGHLALGDRLAERRIQQLTSSIFAVGLLGALALAVAFVAADVPHVVVRLGSLLSLRGYHFDVEMELTPTSLVLLVLDFLLCALVGAYSARYLHRDRGFFRFYLLLVLFALGMELIATAHSLTLLFAGWEFVGITSALLIAFYHRRYGPTRHGLRAYATYRLTDIGLFLAVAILEHAAHSADFDRLGDITMPQEQVTLVALLVVFGAMGKGAMVPFTGWLPKAMEGPTPSSAIFYGALSIHASPYLLLRAEPLLERVPVARLAVLVLGAVTAIHATTVGRTRPDIKTALGYASVAQVALIWMEVAMGWTTLALFHIVGHGVLRTWQLLRSPSVLRERAALARRSGHLALTPGLAYERLLPAVLRGWLYRATLEQWYLDTAARTLLIAPIVWLLRRIDAIDVALRKALGADDVESGLPVHSATAASTRIEVPKADAQSLASRPVGGSR